MQQKPIFSAVAALALLSSPLSAKEVTEQQVVTHYADVAHSVYFDSLATAKILNNSIEQFIAKPSEASFKQVKQAWLNARVPYQQSEVFRFGNPVVDDWEGQLNAWPLDEGLIDYVAAGYQFEMGNDGATANIVANSELIIGNTKVDTATITPQLIASLNELGGSEANVASGYHAIEFLLWGQDLNGTNSGAGERSYTDYVVGEGCTNNNCDRRGQYLQATAQLLVEDLQWMEKQWSADSKDNYRQTLLSEPSENGLRRMLFGMGSLSLGELAGERMKVALEAGSTEDEHDCFSDNTHNSHYYNEQGIYNVYTGTYTRSDGKKIAGPSIADLVQQKDAKAAQQIQQQFDSSIAQVGKLVDSAENKGQHFDQLIASNNKAGQQLVQDTIQSLVEQTKAIEKSATIIGITSLNPDTADHQF
ncbi:imelysin family protein [Vibrio sp. B1Z05]|uniref:imelysin family protein n=1 Tax=Vibrio sp. B1Z05 TaxID=2654980 RepID=UPI00128E54A0|nr:imelysin family protein [Vibrio sp. B1Z05]MPW37202.1 peptidase [Vibrio sp. B1Z05]